jgi:hypothetical protein
MVAGYADCAMLSLRDCMANWTKDTVKLGKILLATQAIFPVDVQGVVGQTPRRPGWHAWLKTTEISESKVSEISDADMIRMYANENATQRGNSGTAIAGSFASAVKFLAKGLLVGSRNPSKRSLCVPARNFPQHHVAP